MIREALGDFVAYFVATRSDGRTDVVLGGITHLAGERLEYPAGQASPAGMRRADPAGRMSNNADAIGGSHRDRKPLRFGHDGITATEVAGAHSSMNSRAMYLRNNRPSWGNVELR